MTNLSPDQQAFVDSRPQNIEYWGLEAKSHMGSMRYSLYAFGRYGRSSVLAGQSKKMFVTSYDTAEEAEQANPGVDWTCPLMQEGNTFDHLGDNYEDMESSNHFNDGEY